MSQISRAVICDIFFLLLRSTLGRVGDIFLLFCGCVSNPFRAERITSISCIFGSSTNGDFYLRNLTRTFYQCCCIRALREFVVNFYTQISLYLSLPGLGLLLLPPPPVRLRRVPHGGGVVERGHGFRAKVHYHFFLKKSHCISRHRISSAASEAPLTDLFASEILF